MENHNLIISSLLTKLIISVYLSSLTSLTSSELISDPHCLWRTNNSSLQCSVNSLSDDVNLNMVLEEDIENKVRELIVFCRGATKEEESPTLVLRLLPRISHLTISRCGKMTNLISGRPGAVPITSLTLTNNKIISIPSLFISSFSSLLTLDISSNALTSHTIKGDLFQKNVQLQIVRLSSNHLTSIDQKLFSQLHSLRSLYIDSNSIDSIHPEAFNSLKSLVLLDLSRNRLVQIQPFNLPLLGHLFLDNNRIANLNQTTFAHLELLEDLGLSGNQFANIPLVINEARNLKTLDIGDNRIKSAEGFSNLTNLYGLRLAGNQLEKIPSDLCESLPNLRVLNVAENQLRIIANFNCQTLTALRLDSNSLTGTLNMESAFESLLWLNVSMNEIEFFKTTDSLEWLDLSFNKMTQVDLDTFHHLRVVDISHNEIQIVKSVPPNVETFLASFNFISQLVSFLDESPSLKKMDLRNNELKYIPQTSPLVQISISGNPLICSCLTKSDQILDFDQIRCNSINGNSLNGNSINSTESENSLCPYESICPDECGCCEFEACDCAMTCPTSCSCAKGLDLNIVKCSKTSAFVLPLKIPMETKELWLDGNFIQNLSPHGFIGKRWLETLYLNSSRIEQISNRSFNGLKSLIKIHLERNRLERIETQFHDTPLLEFIYLQHNEISFVVENAFANLANLRVLNLEGNSILEFKFIGFKNPGVYLALGGNPNSCDCRQRNEISMGQWGHEVKVDFGNCEPCYNETSIKKNEREERYVEEESSAVFWTMVLSILISGTALLGLLLILVKHILEGGEKQKFGNCFTREEPKDEKLFDAYFLYSQKDEDGVVNKITNYLEQNNGDRLCLHFRDLPIIGSPWSPGLMVEAMKVSRVVLVLLSYHLYSECGFFDALARARSASRLQSPPLYFIIGEGGRNGRRLPPDLNSLDSFSQTFWADLRGILTQGQNLNRRIQSYPNHEIKVEEDLNGDHIYSSLDSPHSNSTTDTTIGEMYLV